MRTFAKGTGFIMLSNDCLVQVLRIKAYTECAVWLLGVGEGRYQLGQSGDQGIDSEGNHLFWGLLNLVAVLSWYLLLGILDRGEGGVGTDLVRTGHVSNGVKGEGKGSFEGYDGMGCCSCRG